MNKTNKVKLNGYKYDYFVDSLGNVYKDANKMALSDNGSGYKFVRLRTETKRVNRYVHRLVWESFYGKIPKGYEINHIDHDKNNNSLDNLELVTHQENIDKAVDFGNIKRNWTKKDIQKSSICPVCGGYKIYKSKLCIKCNNRLFAKNKDKYSNKKPNKQILENYIYSDMSIVSISKIFDVADNTIRKWCKSYGLPYKYSDRLKHANKS